MIDPNLNVKTQPRPESRLAVELIIPAEQCKSSFQEALSKLSRTANLPGFRKGKVPQAVILQQLGSKRIQASALEKLLEVSWKKAIEQESITPLCEPELIGGFEDLLENFNIESTLTLTLETDISPTPKLKSTKGLEAKVETVIFDPSKVDDLIEQSRKQLATLIPVENRPAKKGDIAVVSFAGTFIDNNNPIEGGKSDSLDVELTEGQMIPGFTEGIIGMQISDIKSVECIFPKDYPQEDARGRKASFEINLKALKVRELPELDDNFAKQSSDKETIKELRIELKKRLEKDVSQQNIKSRNESLVQALVEQLEVELPQTLINQEIRNLIEQTARTFSQQGIDVKSTFTPELVNKLMVSSKPEAIANLNRQFALEALAKAESIEVEEDAVEKRFQEVKLELKKEKNIDLKRLRAAVSEELLQDKLFLWLEENNTIIEESPEKPEKAKKSSSKANGEKAKTKIKPEKASKS